MNFDISGFQEVSFESKNQLEEMLREGQYSLFFAKSQLNYAKANDIKDEKFNIDGNAIAISETILKNSENQFEHKVLHLSAVRCAQMLSFIRNGITVNYINVHLHHLQEEENIRVYQIHHVLKWIEFNTNNTQLTFIVGDFNATPNSLTYNHIINNGYASLHSKIKGQEPVNTFHNKMDAPFKDDDEPGTFDYIL
jgi:endonuclease/exonuclease/phosphatase family metal-dependent hydrolase